jgi:hypothetical protein
MFVETHPVRLIAPKERDVYLHTSWNICEGRGHKYSTSSELGASWGLGPRAAFPGAPATQIILSGPCHIRIRCQFQIGLLTNLHDI